MNSISRSLRRYVNGRTVTVVVIMTIIVAGILVISNINSLIVWRELQAHPLGVKVQGDILVMQGQARWFKVGPGRLILVEPPAIPDGPDWEAWSSAWNDVQAKITFQETYFPPKVVQIEPNYYIMRGSDGHCWPDRYGSKTLADAKLVELLARFGSNEALDTVLDVNWKDTQLAAP